MSCKALKVMPPRKRFDIRTGQYDPTREYTYNLYGQPRKMPYERRSKKINIRLTPIEYVYVAKIAKSKGITMSDLSRLALQQMIAKVFGKNNEGGKTITRE